ncbi:putative serine/threonine-protein kinase-like protein CCR3 [Tripterygium wilfordii]|uniref:putative serine/threonine-protein kinase-like protein CCR3 n=1 Tax=Tripterygium wilfordii TaxID=458696 RepID=UPI0018F84D77|nr:putative serine/threonine-protein kinase-like protein CCR3 [Tripterygium wilfordii]
MTVAFFSLPFVFIISLLIGGHEVLVNGLGSASTITVIYGTATFCGIIAGEPTQRIQCFQDGKNISVQPKVSFESISGGFSFFCGLRSGGYSILCWDTTPTTFNLTFQPKRIYFNYSIRLTDLTVGYDHLCAREINSGVARCWRGGENGRSLVLSPGSDLRFSTITSGRGFSCGILRNNSRVSCWGNRDIGAEIQNLIGNLTMSNLVAGDSHVCGITRTGILVCQGRNESGQLDVPFSSAYEFSDLALGANFSCAIRQRNGLVLCWGGRGRTQFNNDLTETVSFESIVAGSNIVCGISTRNLSMTCWGPEWSAENSTGNEVPFGMVIPGPCVQSLCNKCGMYPNSEVLCDGSGNICKACQTELPVAVPLPPKTPPPSPPAKGMSKLSLVFLIVGSVGAFFGICSVVYCLWIGACGFLLGRNHNSVQPATMDAMADTSAVPEIGPNYPPLRSFSIRAPSLRSSRRQMSGSSSRYADKTENFSLSELAAATNNFSLENKIGSGSFGIVYKGKLADGREVAIKRGEKDAKAKKFQEKESAFDSELALLSRLHHKHLVSLIGYCEENNERLLVYEYMNNGAVHDHLHGKNNTEKGSSILNSWRRRIKIALDAARGIEYLHNYAVPPIIHRDIKSSNILLDANWTARVSDFGLSLMGPESDQEFMSTKAVGTVGYIDPEYFVLNVLTAKSDVYGLGIVLLELLTGRRAVFKNEEEGTGPMGVVEYARPLIYAGDLQKVLDNRVGPPETHETEAVELMAYTALHCVNLEGKERPNMIDIVANLERALALCEETRPSFSTTTLSTPSD